MTALHHLRSSYFKPHKHSGTFKKALFLILAVFIGCTLSRAQSDPSVTQMLEKIQAKQLSRHFEKIHLHLDASVYLPGETIWFRAYGIGEESKPVQAARQMLHIELREADGHVISKQRLLLLNGMASGEIQIPENTSKGRYTVRAYTRLMENPDSTYSFSKDISIGGEFIPVEKQPGKAPLRFVPEGGQLVAGLRNVIFFNTGRTGIVKGMVVDSNNQKVAGFAGTKFGLGHFDLFPLIGEKYTAVTDLGDGQQERFELGRSFPSGYLLRLDNGTVDSLKLVLEASADRLNGQAVFLVPMLGKHPLFVFKTTFPEAKVSLSVPKEKLPAGIINFVLFNQDAEVLAQRKIFNPAVGQNSINLLGLRAGYTREAKINLPMEVLANDLSPISGSFSVSVTRMDSKQAETKMISDLPAQVRFRQAFQAEGIEQQAIDRFSFIEDEPTLDILLATALSTPLKNHLPNPNEADEDGVSIRGTVLDLRKKPVSGASVTLLVGEPASGNLQVAVTGADGAFHFPVPDSFAFLPMRIQTTNDGAGIMLDEASEGKQGILIMPRPDKNNPVPLYAGMGNSEPLFAEKYSNDGGIQLKTVSVKGRKTTPVSANLNGYGNADVVIGAEQLDKMIDLGTLDALLAGTQMTKDKKLVLRSNAGTHTPPALILLDGTDVGDLGSISPRDIERIEFMKRPAFTGIYGIRGAGGVLLITTKSGLSPNMPEKNNGIIRFQLPIRLNQQFLPAFNGKSTTLFWNPEIHTDWAGRGELVFQTGNIPGVYEINIEGIGAKGEWCAQKYRFIVE